MNPSTDPHTHAAGPSGSGPGTITPDGCSVELYSLLPAMGEPEIIHAAVPARATILELGAGAGRVTHRLLELGHPVVAVDESAEMLARIRGADAHRDGSGGARTTPAPAAPTQPAPTPPAPTPPAPTPAAPTSAGPAPAAPAPAGVETVRARIQELHLGRRFDVVLLASFLVNTPDRELRRRFLTACREHVRDDGCVLVQRHEPAWFEEAAEGERSSGGITFRLRDLTRPGPGLLSATVEYQAGEHRWTQSFTTERLDDEQLAAALGEVGLVVDAYLTGDGSWVRAVPAPPGRALGRSPR